MILELQDIHHYYGDAEALHGVSLSVDEGAIIAIVGANGAGKTSLIRTIAGLERPRAGRIVFRGKNIAGLESHKVVEFGIGHVPEGRQIFPSMTVLENLEMGATPRRARGKVAAGLEEVYTLFPRLAERRLQLAGTLSGGEQQMLAIGRCIMGQPELIMFDEPSVGLAPTLVKEVFATIRTLNERGRTIILVEQNVAMSLRIASSAYVLENGRMVMSGSGAALLGDDRIREAYLGL